MYLPKLFGCASVHDIKQIIERNSFATLIVAREDGLEISHLPIVLEGTLAGGVLRGHMARANPQLALCTGDAKAIAIFHGPHAYVSPTWYAEPGVPTWNYIAVHCHGRIHLEDTAMALEDTLKFMLDQYEGGQWSMDDLPSDQKARALSAIQSFRIKIERVEAKFKLSQNKPPTERRRVIERLRQSGSNSDLVEWMEKKGPKQR
jgi:transcriptional regulator